MLIFPQLILTIFHFRFVERDHIPHCPPDSVSTGLGSLPLLYVYVNGTRTNKATTQKLPSGEKLNGRDSYVKLLAHFTTTTQTPDEIYSLGTKMRDKLYTEVHNIDTNKNRARLYFELFPSSTKLLIVESCYQGPKGAKGSVNSGP